MSLLAAAINPTPRANSSSWAPDDDRWYSRDLSTHVAQVGATGLALTGETILNCGTVLAAVRFRGDAWAMSPPSTYVRTARGRNDEPQHPSQLVLRNPNAWQTGNRWRHLMGVWLAIWGNAYSRMVPGPRSFADELWPMHPSVSRPVDQRDDGSLVYEYTPPMRKREMLGSERVMHFRDLGVDGFQGVAMYQLIRNVVMIALLAEQHAQTFLRKGTRISGLLVPSAPLKKEQREDLKTTVNADLSGANMTGALGILPHGVDLKTISMTNRDGQVLELGDQVVGSILRFLGVPGVVVGWQGDKNATYASAKEFFESGGIKHCILPIITNVEAEEEKALLVAGDGRFIRHNLDVLQRASLKDRYEAFSKALGSAPFLTVNEVRGTDDWNANLDPRHDEIRIPSNMQPIEEEPEPPEPTPARRRPPHDDGGQDDDARRVLPFPARASAGLELLRGYARDNAGRVVRREIAAISAKAPKLARDREAWKAFVLETYEKHVTHVVEVMRVDEISARAYCDRQAAQLLADGASAAENWESEAVQRLAALALMEVS